MVNPTGPGVPNAAGLNLEQATEVNDNETVYKRHVRTVMGKRFQTVLKPLGLLCLLCAIQWMIYGGRKGNSRPGGNAAVPPLGDQMQYASLPFTFDEPAGVLAIHTATVMTLYSVTDCWKNWIKTLKHTEFKDPGWAFGAGLLQAVLAFVWGAWVMRARQEGEYLIDGLAALRFSNCLMKMHTKMSEAVMAHHKGRPAHEVNYWPYVYMCTTDAVITILGTFLALENGPIPLAFFTLIAETISMVAKAYSTSVDLYAWPEWHGHSEGVVMAARRICQQASMQSVPGTAMGEISPGEDGASEDNLGVVL